ncbi:SAM-dependent methyltransferase [Reticulibacter mediterranei]|uniref:SAM-dependent methyltransferase n=1 Tax=Reticulibacter mediterranei TaxID=2778369 RepID=A0A8J3IS12_9CHLR|nr:methyltransferase [Reticulibacter mediterranei]GHO96829.1 SAM-dependent methyltransferase [Reticulibacter mediterranei]
MLQDHEHSSKERAEVEGDDAIRSISAIAYGFMGSQALFAALELGLFTSLSDEPCELEALAEKLQMPSGPLSVLLSTCVALRLLTWDGQRYSNSPAAQRFLVRTTRSYVGDYYLRQISSLIYSSLPQVRSLLRGESEPIARDYASTLADPWTTEEFVRGQHAGSLGPAILLSRSLDISGFSQLLDLGGGSGAFAIELVKRSSELSAVVFDLPQVVAVTEKILQETGLTGRITCASGDLRSDPWPSGADLILMSYIVSCYDPTTLHTVLARTYDYLPPDGQLLIHDFAISADRSGPRNAALFLFGQLTVSAQTRAYTTDELKTALQEAGYHQVTVQPFIPDLTFLIRAYKPGSVKSV